jgi:hypothetical protein
VSAAPRANEIDIDQRIRVKCAFDEKRLLNPASVPDAALLRRNEPDACA